jgi:hypothetical protein
MKQRQFLSKFFLRFRIVMKVSRIRVPPGASNSEGRLKHPFSSLRVLRNLSDFAGMRRVKNSSESSECWISLDLTSLPDGWNYYLTWCGKYRNNHYIQNHSSLFIRR